MKSILIATAIFGAVVTLAGQAQADCRLTLQPALDQWRIEHSPFQADGLERRFDVMATNQGDAACTGQVRFDLKGAPFGLSLDGVGGERIAYGLIDERASADVTPRAGATTLRNGQRVMTLAPGEQQLLRFALVAPGNDLLSAGDYSQTVFLSFQDGRGSPLAERPVLLNIHVPAVAVMGLKGEFRRSNGIARVDLGNLTQGDRDLNTSLYVLSTGGYAVSITSANAGRLRQGDTDWTINYTLRLGRHAVNLRRGERLEKPSRNWQADDYPLVLSIGDVKGRRFGEYNDTLTFTIAAI